MASNLFSIPKPAPLDELLSLNGKCAIVTGGRRGLGEAIVRQLAQAGAAVALTGRGGDALQRVESEINAAGGQAVGVQTDPASLKDSQNVIDRTVERFGRVDILVNNAAVLSTDALRPTGALSAYGAAKLGLWSATQAMAKFLKRVRSVLFAKHAR